MPPTTRYPAMVAKARDAPYDAPTSSTPNVCPVSGTGVFGSGIEICADSAISVIPRATRTASATRATERLLGRTRDGTSAVDDIRRILEKPESHRHPGPVSGRASRRWNASVIDGAEAASRSGGSPSTSLYSRESDRWDRGPDATTPRTLGWTTIVSTTFPWELSSSSAVTTIASRPARKSGPDMASPTSWLIQSSAVANEQSCASWQTSGTTMPASGSRPAATSSANRVSGRSNDVQSGRSEMKYVQGLCRTAYSPAFVSEHGAGMASA